MNVDPYDAVQDARSEALYSDDPREEPDLSEVKDALAGMRGVETVGDHRIVFPR